MTAAELLAAYAARERSPVEVVAELSAAVEADPHGAFWTTCLERAAAEARAAEDAWARGNARPLEGVPIAGAAVAGAIGAYWTLVSAHFIGLLFRRHARALSAVYF